MVYCKGICFLVGKVYSYPFQAEERILKMRFFLLFTVKFSFHVKIALLDLLLFQLTSFWANEALLHFIRYTSLLDEF